MKRWVPFRCVYSLNENISEAIVSVAWRYFQYLLQKMIGWVAFEVSLHFSWKFKPFNKLLMLSLSKYASKFLSDVIHLLYWKIIWRLLFVCLFVCIFYRFSEIYIVFERGPRLAIMTSSNQRLPQKIKLK